MDNVVAFEQVAKKFAGRTVLSEISFRLPRGKVVGLIGPNGAGKSTMLKLMAGLLRPSGGTVLVDGRRAERRSSRSIAYLPERGGVYPFYSVRETMHYYADVFEDFDYGKAADMLAFMKLDPAAKAGALSKGHLARLKLVLALSRRAPLLLLDEPLSGLDPMIRESIVKGLAAFIDVPEQTVVMTTHEIAEVEPLLDMAIAVNEGKILRIDEVENIRGEFGGSLLAWMKEAYRQ